MRKSIRILQDLQEAFDEETLRHLRGRGSVENKWLYAAYDPAVGPVIASNGKPLPAATQVIDCLGVTRGVEALRRAGAGIDVESVRAWWEA